jgi:hypothetical protein
VDDPEDVDRSLRDPKNSSIISIKDMAVSGAQDLILWDGRASFGMLFQGADLGFNTGDESFRFERTILADIVPNILQVPLGGLGDLNLVSNGHA